MATVYTLNGKVLKNSANDKWLIKKEGSVIIQPNVSPDASTYTSASLYNGPYMSQSGEVRIDLTTTYIINYPSSNVSSIIVEREASDRMFYPINTYNNPSGTVTIKFGDYISSSQWNDTSYIRFLLKDNDNHVIYEATTLTPVS